MGVASVEANGFITLLRPSQPSMLFTNGLIQEVKRCKRIKGKGEGEPSVCPTLL